jgi:hypothetical protein
MDVNLGDVVEKSLRKKLPKLVNTKSNRRILLLERQHMNLPPEMMLQEIRDRRAAFPELSSMDEIWIIETIFYGTAFGGTYLRFELYRDGNVVRSYDFNVGKLISASEDGWPKIIQYGQCSRGPYESISFGHRRRTAFDRAKTVEKPLVLEALRLALSEKQIPQTIESKKY